MDEAKASELAQQYHQTDPDVYERQLSAFLTHIVKPTIPDFASTMQEKPYSSMKSWEKVLVGKIHDSVFVPLLDQCRADHPSLFRTLLRHPLLTGQPKLKGRSSSRTTGSTTTSPQDSTPALQPDFSGPLPSRETMARSLAILVARAVASGSLQHVLIVLMTLLSLRNVPLYHNLSLPVGPVLHLFFYDFKGEQEQGQDQEQHQQSQRRKPVYLGRPVGKGPGGADILDK